jgi:hypothetical protein
MSICEIFKDRDHAKLVQARKALTEHIFGQVANRGWWLPDWRI